MKIKYQVFISSTFLDLIKEREIITKAVIDMGFIPSGMESFPASDVDQFRYIKKVIDDCDYYLLVLGGRYGSITAAGISYTESEYDYAVETNKTILAFIHESPSNFQIAVVVNTEEARQKFEAFRIKTMSGRMVKYWNSSDQLALHAMTALHHAKDDYPGIGWIRGNFKENTDLSAEYQNAQSQLWRLQHETTELKEDNNSLQNSITSLFNSSTKPATAAELNTWIEGAKINYPDKNLNNIKNRNVRYATKDFILPSLYGVAAATVIVGSGVTVHNTGSNGHSALLYMDGFRMEGIH